MEWLIGIGILGLIVGSFLNVVILRLPQMILHEWEPNKASSSPFNLATPSSHCPHCKHPLSALENIPLISFIFLRGRCKACHQAIAWRYPLVELGTALLSMATAYHFGFHFNLMGALILTWSLIVLTAIDIDHQLLPDDITLPLLWLGLAFNIFNGFVSLKEAVLGAMIGYLFLWSIYWIYKALTGKEGMGYGDFKLLAALGAWLGWTALPIIILLASITGAILGIAAIVFRGRSHSTPIPFGPFLALAGWIALIWGDKITHYYLSLSHLS